MEPAILDSTEDDIRKLMEDFNANDRLRFPKEEMTMQVIFSRSKDGAYPSRKVEFMKLVKSMKGVVVNGDYFDFATIQLTSSKSQ